jgi:hypothetical protein
MPKRAAEFILNRYFRAGQRERKFRRIQMSSANLAAETGEDIAACIRHCGRSFLRYQHGNRRCPQQFVNRWQVVVQLSLRLHER